ncbi:MAG: hypothetical protein PHF33_10375 [Candidatus Delongbacteria bacterium]|jgi:hypothetical protein|nr:hypothetical protein [Candidatus Delongbacteria bacterium]
MIQSFVEVTGTRTRIAEWGSYARDEWKTSVAVSGFMLFCSGSV